MLSTPPAFLAQTSSPLGNIWLTATAHGLSGVWFDGQKHLPDLRDSNRFTAGSNTYTDAAHAWLKAYFSGTSAHALQTPQLDLSAGTPFQQAVWQQLLRIAPGATQSYGAVAQAVGQAQGKPSAARAVGAAVGRNPVSVIVPCHRVIGGNGSLTGYAGGLERKIKLLQLEGVLKVGVLI